jgi:predicted RNA-binding Zn-ribbon protein involved in translation (DUF1610 family)
VIKIPECINNADVLQLTMKYMKTNCANCGKEIERETYRVKKGNCYCNARCQMEYEYKNKIRDKNKTVEKAHERVRQKSKERFATQPNVMISKRGYRMIYIPMVGWKNEHLLVWEKNYGKIPPGFHIHHINFDRFDNRIENLTLLSAHEHIKLHDRVRKRTEKGTFAEGNGL